ncbi:unnamed protein product (macronuclear) [Paramecium tetraurelia]|uniref:Uncharacterized protein n=1 Tax=Paramecium tetraurelia TaxID=5888 RepID=A0D9Y4_PARTE|nr:uncharacterized protein GSPATT00014783001 [Paramecium tetraurelia]CAK79851.1 unnamed protein product [Paramecium tetraurelia]|eukprot:XP_001447248.1 hypothetical protein (macronuclear) [Paramecium tetraurelia strain d4-2]
MRNRCSFTNKAQQFPLHPSLTINRKRSCECLDCGLHNKKMLYVTTVLPQFQPYQHIITALKEQNEISEQRKRMKLRNKRYLIQMKNIVEKIQKQEYKPKKRQNRHHHTVFYNHQANASNPSSLYTNEIAYTPSEPIQSSSVLFHRYNSLTPQKYFTDQKIMKVQKFSQKLKTFYLPITAPFESQIILRLQLLQDGKVKLIKQSGFQDDFTVNLRLNKFQEDDKKIEDKEIKNKITLPTLQQEDEEEELTDEEINMKKLASYNKKNAYKNILKYNPRTLQSLVDKSQLGQSKIKAYPKQLNQNHIALLHRSVTTNMSPFNNSSISRASPISSIQLLREKRIKPKLLPLENKPLSKFALTHNSPTKQSNTKLNPKKGLQKSILSISGKKQNKNIIFRQLMIQI